MNFGKFKYEESKKAQEARKKQSYIQIKEIKLRPRTDTHDIEIKKRHIRGFLADGDKVKVTLRFRGREIVHKHLGLDVLQRLAQELSDVAVMESMPNLEGRAFSMMLAPKK